MQMKCPGCGAGTSLSETRCAACGRLTDADGDGVPDALDQLVERKARAILDAERHKKAAERNQQALDDAVAELRIKEETCAKLLSEYETSASRSLVRIFFDRFVTVAGETMVAWVLLGVVAHWLVFGAIGRSPAGPILCPIQCPTCKGPGRVFNFVQGGRCGGECNHLVCNNDRYDVETISYEWVREHETELEPYKMSVWLSFPTEGAFVAILVGLLAGLTARRQRRALEAKAERTARELDDIRARLEELVPHSPEQGPFR